MKATLFFLILGLLVSPLLALADSKGPICIGPNAVGVIVYICAATQVIRWLIPIVFSFALVAFLWGLAKLVLNAADEKSRIEGRQLMIWGVIALFVASSIWGIIYFFSSALDLAPGGGLFLRPV